MLRFGARSANGSKASNGGHVLGFWSSADPKKARSTVLASLDEPSCSLCLLRQANGEQGRLLSGVSIRNAISLSLAVIKLRWNSPLQSTGGPKHLSLGGHGMTRVFDVCP